LSRPGLHETLVLLVPEVVLVVLLLAVHLHRLAACRPELKATAEGHSWHLGGYLGVS
jgi:hypothetical protein